MSRSQRRAMIDREEPKLSLVRQCALLGISRSSLYYLPTEAGAEDLELMALIDQQYPVGVSPKGRTWRWAEGSNCVCRGWGCSSEDMDRGRHAV